MADLKSWDDFDVFYPPEDNLTQAVEGHPSNEDGIWQARHLNVVDPDDIEFALGSDADVRWWKGLRVLASTGHELGRVSTQDDHHGLYTLRYRVDALAGGQLELQKAKAFGVHTGMYLLRLDDMPHRGGTRYAFQWHRDG